VLLPAEAGGLSLEVTYWGNRRQSGTYAPAAIEMSFRTFTEQQKTSKLRSDLYKNQQKGAFVSL
jgi:hypothetical protein